MGIQENALNAAADAITVDTIKLHSGDPGSSGTQNEISGTSTSVTLGAASGGERTLSGGTLEIDVPAGTVSHYSLWQGSTLKVTNALEQSETYQAPGVARVTSAKITIGSL